MSFAGEATELEVLAKQPARRPWAWLQQRVFAVDIMTSPRCRGAMRLVKIANKPDDIGRVLADLGLVRGPAPESPESPEPVQLPEAARSCLRDTKSTVRTA